LPKKVAFRKMRFLSAQALRKHGRDSGYRNLSSETMAQFHRALEGAILRLSDGAYPLGHIRVAFTVPANNSKRAGMEKLAGDHRRNSKKKIRRRSEHH
jgi:hypothetical protein